MKEFVEKLIERLEGESYLTTNDDGETDKFSIQVVEWKDIKKIAKDLASEHNNGWIEKLLEAKKNCGEDSDCSECPFGQIEDRCILQELQFEKDNGWIPCSERLPSKEEYQKCNGQFIVSDGNRTYATYFDIYDTLKFGEPTITKFVIDRCVIAWQPLPEQYREERSE